LSAPVSAIGNGLVFVAVLKTRALHTSANILIGSLVLADFLVGALVQPLVVGVMTSENYHDDCLFVDSSTYLAFSIGSISASTMAAVSCERYIALFFPMRYTEILTNKRAYITASSIWVGWFVVNAFSFAENTTLPMMKTVIGNIFYSFGLLAIFFSYVKIFFLVRYHRRQIQVQLSASSSSSTTNQLKGPLSKPN
jgi:hypothetical protein